MKKWLAWMHWGSRRRRCGAGLRRRRRRRQGARREIFQTADVRSAGPGLRRQGLHERQEDVRRTADELTIRSRSRSSRAWKAPPPWWDFTLKTWQTQLSPDQWTQGINKAVEEGYTTHRPRSAACRRNTSRRRSPEAQRKASRSRRRTTTTPRHRKRRDIPRWRGQHRLCHGRQVDRRLDDRQDRRQGQRGDRMGPDEITPTTPLQERDLRLFQGKLPGLQMTLHQHAGSGMGDQDPAGGAGRAAGRSERSIMCCRSTIRCRSSSCPRSSRAGSKAKIVSYNGTPFVLDMMRDGDMVEMDVGESLGWVGMAGIDADMRLLCGMKAGRPSSTRPPTSSPRRTCDRRQARELQRRLRRRPYRRLQEALGPEVSSGAPPTRGAHPSDALVVEISPSGSAGRSALDKRRSRRCVAARCMVCSAATVRASRR